jgi:hypothetical protein
MESKIFDFLSYSPGPFWLILLVAPTHQTMMKIFDGYLLLLAAIFAVLTVPVVPELLPVIAEPSLVEIQKFLSSDKGTIGAWNHMILGDLWIGRWVIHDAIRNDVHFLIRFTILMIILFFGPLGLFAYLGFRMIYLRKFSLLEEVAYKKSLNS